MGNCCSDRKKKEAAAQQQAQSSAEAPETTGLLAGQEASSSHQDGFPSPRQDAVEAAAEAIASAPPADIGAGDTGSAGGLVEPTKGESDDASAAPGAPSADTGASGVPAAAAAIAVGQGQEPEGQLEQQEHAVFTKDDEALNLQAQLHSAVGGQAPVIIPLFGDETSDAASQELVKLISQKMGEALKGKACFVTCSQTGGAQELFAKSFPDPPGLFNLCKVGGSSGYGVGKDEPRARDAEHLSAIFTQIGDIVLAVGPVNAATEQAAWWQDVCMSYAWGAVVVHVVSGGGAGKPDALAFPRPPCVPEASWEALSSPTASHAAKAEAAVATVQSLYAARQASVEEMQQSAKDNWRAAHNQIRQRAVIGHLGGSKLQDAISKEEVAQMEDQDFEGALSRLGERKKTRGAVGKAHGSTATVAAEMRPTPAAKGEAPAAPQTSSGTVPVAPSKKLAEATRIDKLPPPTTENHVTKANEHVNEIEEARKRMEARMEEMHKKLENDAAVKIQANARGSAARKSLATKKEEKAPEAAKQEEKAPEAAKK